ncbi:MAG: MFS transporter [Zetaproteobacteria bacterium]|nr:MFS transporter [Zetaproteobacteria bacterium]
MAAQQTARSHSYWRLRIFSGMYIGYVTYYLTRKSFTFAMPSMIAELGYSKADLGILASGLYLSYGASKLVSGIMSDKFSSRIIMSLGLILTGLANVLFGMASEIMTLTALWSLNGFFQGFGFAPIAKQLTYWFPSAQRGRWWTIISSANNVGGALAPILVSTILVFGSWRIAMTSIGYLAIGMGILVALTIRDSPETLGLSSVKEKKFKANSEESTKAPSLKEAIFNRPILLLAIAYFCVYVVRSGLNDWVALYLHQSKGLPFSFATRSVGWFEFGGFIGSIMSGWVSDHYFGGKRIPLMIGATTILFFTISWFTYTDVDDPWTLAALVGICGTGIFVPQALIGLASAEYVDKRVAGTAYGFTGGVSYMGAAASGYPLGYVIDTWGWDGFFLCMGIATLCILISLAPLYFSQQGEPKTAATAPV